MTGIVVLFPTLAGKAMDRGAQNVTTHFTGYVFVDAKLVRASTGYAKT